MKVIAIGQDTVLKRLTLLGQQIPQVKSYQKDIFAYLESKKTDVPASMFGNVRTIRLS